MTSNDEKQKIYIMAVEMGDNSEDCWLQMMRNSQKEFEWNDGKPGVCVCVRQETEMLQWLQGWRPDTVTLYCCMWKWNHFILVAGPVRHALHYSFVFVLLFYCTKSCYPL